MQYSKLVKGALLALCIGASLPAMAMLQQSPVEKYTDEQPADDPGCPAGFLTDYEQEKIFAALSKGQTVIECQAGVCKDFVTDKPFNYEGEVDDGFYFIDLEPNPQPQE